LDSNFSEVPGARLQQFNRSPQFGLAEFEQNADFIELSIPLSAFGNPGSNEIVRLAAVVGGGAIASNSPPLSRNLDQGFWGRELSRLPSGESIVVPHQFQLPVDPDPDADGLNTNFELFIGTNPNDPDTDHDQLPDGWEVEKGIDPLSAVLSDGAEGDPDQDRMTNLQEYFAGTNPKDPKSLLQLAVSSAGVAGTIELAWNVFPGKKYEIETSLDLNSRFSALERFSVPITAPAGVFRYEPTNAQKSLQYFRVKLVP
jgi:hypothetical protein